MLNIYPKLKGIQVMDDEGGYMFGDYRGKWIPDSPARRKVILNLFRDWKAFSNSSPSEGIIAGDEAPSGPATMRSASTCSATTSPVRRFRKSSTRWTGSTGASGTGESMVRIHGLGFPWGAQYPQFGQARFATLMRILCARNGGVFVGLPEDEYVTPRRSN